MRAIIQFFASFDVITPAIGLVQDIINDPTLMGKNSWTFFIPYSSSLGNGWNAADIDKLMKTRGIKTWGTQITNGDLFFSVSRDEAKTAEFILSANNIPIAERSRGA